MSLFQNLFGGVAPRTTRRVSGDEAWRLVREAEAVLVDVRTPAEFAGGHADGAVNVPLQELSQRLHEIPSHCPVVVYCRSGGRSASAAALLTRAGRDVHDAGGLHNLHR